MAPATGAVQLLNVVPADQPALRVAHQIDLLAPSRASCSICSASTRARSTTATRAGRRSSGRDDRRARDANPEPFRNPPGCERRLATVGSQGTLCVLRVPTRAGDRGRTGDVQLGKLSWPLRGKGFSAAVAETGYRNIPRPAWHPTF